MRGGGGKVYGIDLNAEIIGNAIPQSKDFTKRINCIAGNALSLPFQHSSFNKVAILDCLEHIEEDFNVIKEIKRVLKPNGKLLITVPTIPGHPPHSLLTRIIPHLPEKLLLKATSDDIGNTLQHCEQADDSITLGKASQEDILKAFGHVRHYDEKSITELLHENGFEIVKIYRFQMLFESEMICFHFTVKGFQSIFTYPFMKAIACLDYLLPKSYPGVGLIVVAKPIA